MRKWLDLVVGGWICSSAAAWVGAGDYCQRPGGRQAAAPLLLLRHVSAAVGGTGEEAPVFGLWWGRSPAVVPGRLLVAGVGRDSGWPAGWLAVAVGGRSKQLRVPGGWVLLTSSHGTDKVQPVRGHPKGLIGRSQQTNRLVLVWFIHFFLLRTVRFQDQTGRTIPALAGTYCTGSFCISCLDFEL